MLMNRLFALFLFLSISFIEVNAQDIEAAAEKFSGLLSAEQKLKAIFPFDVDDRYNFHYFPVDDHKGIPMDQLNHPQQEAAVALMKTCLDDHTVSTARSIMSLEALLKTLERRAADDHFRDPGKYFFTIFGIPAKNTTWGWRLDGHHVCFSFSVKDNKLVSGTPGFLGSNPAVVQDGTNKGMELLKDEKNLAFNLLNSFSAEQKKKVIFADRAPGDIVTGINRKAMIDHPVGLSFSEMDASQREKFLALINVYVHRYTKLFADDMLKEIESAGLDKLKFAWAGFTEPGLGKPHYYRIQGPTLIIEYDNTQNNANHVHTVLRDLLHDFGGDLLLEHYKENH